jgi:hypothetical protein
MLIQFYTRNPKVAAPEKPDHYRIRVKDVPCSADDGQIYRYLEKQSSQSASLSVSYSVSPPTSLL